MPATGRKGGAPRRTSARGGRMRSKSRGAPYGSRRAASTGAADSQPATASALEPAVMVAPVFPVMSPPMRPGPRRRAGPRCSDGRARLTSHASSGSPWWRDPPARGSRWCLSECDWAGGGEELYGGATTVVLRVNAYRTHCREVLVCDPAAHGGNARRDPIGRRSPRQTPGRRPVVSAVGGPPGPRDLQLSGTPAGAAA